MQSECGIVAAQVAHETGWWTSYAAVQLHNPAGVGITNDLPQAQWPGFPSIQAGLRAQCAHLLTYVLGSQPGRSDDPRYQAAVDAGYAGKVHIIGGLSGTWAWPGTTYGQSLVTLANDLVASIGGTQVATVIKGKYIDVIDMTNWNGPNRPGYPMVPEYITVHETANPTPGADSIMHAKFVQNGGGAQGVSFHRSVDDHQSTKILNDNENGWHAGDGRDGPATQGLRLRRASTATATGQDQGEPLLLVAQLCDEHNIPADADHIKQHNFFSGKDSRT